MKHPQRVAQGSRKPPKHCRRVRGGRKHRGMVVLGGAYIPPKLGGTTRWGTHVQAVQWGAHSGGTSRGVGQCRGRQRIWEHLWGAVGGGHALALGQRSVGAVGMGVMQVGRAGLGVGGSPPPLPSPPLTSGHLRAPCPRSLPAPAWAPPGRKRPLVGPARGTESNGCGRCCGPSCRARNANPAQTRPLPQLGPSQGPPGIKGVKNPRGNDGVPITHG